MLALRRNISQCGLPLQQLKTSSNPARPVVVARGLRRPTSGTCLRRTAFFHGSFRCLSSLTEASLQEQDAPGRPSQVVAQGSRELEKHPGQPLSTTTTTDNPSRQNQNPSKQNLVSSPSPPRSRQNPWTLVPLEILEMETNRLRGAPQEPKKNASPDHQNRRPSYQNRSSTQKRQIRLEDYLDILEAWRDRAANGGGIAAARHAEALLESMTEQQRGVDPLSLGCYQTVLEAYLQCQGGIQAAERAEIVLCHLLNNQHAGCIPKATVRTCNIALEAWALSASQEAVARITRIRHMMDESGIPADATTNQIEMKALSTSGHSQAPEQILELILRIASERQSDATSAVTPTMSMFHTAMTALAKSATHHNQRGVRQVAEQLDMLLQTILERQATWKLQPSLRTFMIVLGAWERTEQAEKTGAAAQRAEYILDGMIRSAILPQSHSSTQVVQPVTICFTSVMVAWCHAGKPERAESIYFRLVNLYNQTKRDGKYLPTTVGANVVLNGWAKQGRADRVMELMKTMQRVAMENQRYTDCQFTLQTFNILLNALGKQGQAEDALQLMSWLEGHTDRQPTREDKFSDFFKPQTIRGLEKPNVVSYATAVVAVAGNPDFLGHAEAMMERMKQNGMQPAQATYTSVIHAYVPLMDMNKVHKAHKLFHEAQATQKPDGVLCTAFLQVCSNAMRAEQYFALDHAISVYESLDPRQRNYIFYCQMIKVIRYLVTWSGVKTSSGGRWSTAEQVQAERLGMLRRVAKECCDGGHLGQNLLDEMEKEIRGQGVRAASWLGSDRLHPEWSRKVPMQHRPHTLRDKAR